MKPALVAVYALAAIAGIPGQSENHERALVAAEAVWSTKKPSEYEFALELRCFCPVSAVPLSFRVNKGTATLLTKSDDPRRTYSFYERFNTIDKLFAVLRQYLKQQPSSMTVTYDSQLGYPASAAIDVRPDIYDDELSFRVSGFKAVTGAIVIHSGGDPRFGSRPSWGPLTPRLGQ